MDLQELVSEVFLVSTSMVAAVLSFSTTSSFPSDKIAHFLPPAIHLSSAVSVTTGRQVAG